MHALVTGATGFTGSHLARTLAARGQTVRAFVRDAGRARSLEAEGIQLAVGDIRDRVALEAATAGVEVVYHLAAIYRQAGVKREVYQAVNASAVRDIVDVQLPRRRATRGSLQHRRAFTGISSIRRPAKTPRSGRVIRIKSPSLKVNGWRAKQAIGSASRSRLRGPAAFTVPAIGGC